MELPIDVVNRIFVRLSSTYGAEFGRMWEGQPMVNVKAAWAHELGGFAGQLECIAWALENLPEQPPNAIRFRNLCRQAPAPKAKGLPPPPPANPRRVAAELSKLRGILADKTAPGHGKDWAHRIVTQAQRGEPVKPLQLRLAREALRGRSVDADTEGQP